MPDASDRKFLSGVETAKLPTPFYVLHTVSDLLRLTFLLLIVVIASTMKLHLLHSG